MDLLPLFTGVMMWIKNVFDVTGTKKGKKRVRKGFWVISIAIAIVGIAGWFHRSGKKVALQSGEDKSSSPILFAKASAQDALRDAQHLEMLQIYCHPEDFEMKYKPLLSNHWLTRDQGGKEIDKIERAVEGLITRGRKYGSNSTLDKLEITKVEITDDTAILSTRELWYLPVVDKEGRPVIARDVSESKKDWRIVYKMRKVNNRWLIEETTSPYKR